jgi:hypothetical protein
MVVVVVVISITTITNNNKGREPLRPVSRLEIGS